MSKPAGAAPGGLNANDALTSTYDALAHGTPFWEVFTVLCAILLFILIGILLFRFTPISNAVLQHRRFNRTVKKDAELARNNQADRALRQQGASSARLPPAPPSPPVQPRGRRGPPR